MFIQRFLPESGSTADACKCLKLSLFLSVAEGEWFLSVVLTVATNYTTILQCFSLGENKKKMKSKYKVFYTTALKDARTAQLKKHPTTKNTFIHF